MWAVRRTALLVAIVLVAVPAAIVAASVPDRSDIFSSGAIRFSASFPFPPSYSFARHPNLGLGAFDDFVDVSTWTSSRDFVSVQRFPGSSAAAADALRATARYFRGSVTERQGVLTMRVDHHFVKGNAAEAGAPWDVEVAKVVGTWVFYAIGVGTNHQLASDLPDSLRLLSAA